MMKNYYLQKITTGLNKIIIKKTHYITMQSMDKNNQIYNEKYKITKENVLKVDVTGIFLQLVSL